MPILRGSVTFARFRVEHSKNAPSDLRRWFLKGLKSNAFEELDRRGGPDADDRSAGFAQLEDPNATEFAPSNLYYGERALFCWRIDQLRVSASAVRQRLEEWVRAFEQENDRKPARSEKASARANIRQTLRSQATPVMKTHDVAWDLKRGQLQIWSSSRKVVDELLAAIETGFEVRIVPLAPGAVASADGGKTLTPTLIGLPAAVPSKKEVLHGAA